ncbi:MAG TPA: glycosyltransferase family 39 protein [Acidobacteriota bacterium]|nr:glycosyltransferase family 39 protein [Acidobacteriota bacterium]
MPDRTSRLFASTDFWVVLALVLAALPITVPALDSFFTFDDLMNLSRYERDPWEAAQAALILFTSKARPLGALFYLPLFWLFGMDPFPYYLLGAALVTLNLILLYGLVRRYGGSPVAGATACLFAAFMPHVINVLYNFGAIYESASLLFILGALHCYKSYLESRRAAWYAAMLACFWAGLNSKELAVVLPVLLLAYELLWGTLAKDLKEKSLWQACRPLLLRLAPLGAISVLYTLAKTLGPEAYWRDNPQYVYHFGWLPLRNLRIYLEMWTGHAFTISHFEIGLLLLAVLGLAWWLRSRLMIFGLVFAFMTLLPILPLDRRWALFLYLPGSGLGMLLGGLAGGLWDKIEQRLPPWADTRRRPLAGVAAPVAVLAIGLLASYPSVNREAEHFMEHVHKPVHQFAASLYRQVPEAGPHDIFGLVDVPFDLDSHEYYIPYFLVRLGYGHEHISVFYLPSSLEAWKERLPKAERVHVLRWTGTQLVKGDRARWGVPEEEPESAREERR